jgi:hypothetical protein
MIGLFTNTLFPRRGDKTLNAARSVRLSNVVRGWYLGGLSSWRKRVHTAVYFGVHSEELFEIPVKNK